MLVAIKINVAQEMIIIFDKIENTVEKRENAGYQNFLLFQQCIYWVKG